MGGQEEFRTIDGQTNEDSGGPNWREVWPGGSVTVGFYPIRPGSGEVFLAKTFDRPCFIVIFDGVRLSLREKSGNYETAQPWLLYLQLMINNHNLAETMAF